MARQDGVFANSRCVHEAITIGNYSIFATFVRSLALLLSIVQLTRMHKCKPSAASMLSFSFAMSPQAHFLPCCSGSQRWSCCSLLASSCAALAAQEIATCGELHARALRRAPACGRQGQWPGTLVRQKCPRMVPCARSRCTR